MSLAHVKDAVEANKYHDLATMDARQLHGLEDPRSRMNACFRIGGHAADIGEAARKANMELERKFCEEAERHTLHQLSGHHLFGGLRIALYNQVDADAVIDLVRFMERFSAEHKDEVAR